MAKKIEPVMYGDRDSLDENLQSVLAEVKSAEEEAKRIIAQAEREKRVRAAEEQGERLIAEKQKAVAARTAELYAALGGKK